MLVVAGLAVMLALGGATAGADRGAPGKNLRLGKAGAAELVREAAQQLNVTEAALTEAIVDAAIARIDEAVAEDELPAARATRLKTRVGDNLSAAIAISRTSKVASNLDVTTAQLNDAFRAARKALLLKRIDEAVAEGDLSEERAARLKTRLANAKLPGYKEFSLRG